MPWHFKLSACFGLHKLIPAQLLTKPNAIIHYFFGVRKHKNVKELLNSLLLSSDLSCNLWSIHRLVNWENIKPPDNLVHIHGTNDKVFPIKNVKPDYTIQGGSHFMVWSRAAEVSEILQKELAAL